MNTDPSPAAEATLGTGYRLDERLPITSGRGYLC
ncbi:MAG: hypothetical protein QOK15_2817 [Nocardioidaceae bacterium]|jgi:hypothetical protein|nr:hypothetical protein [Nocardioidaceae bacterium]